MQNGQIKRNLIGRVKDIVWPFIPASGKYLLKKFRYESIPVILLRIAYFRRFLRVQKLPTLMLKPVDRVNYYFIDINLGYKCNMKCLNCEASCRQAPSEERMSLEQINKFIDESIKQGRKWKIINLVGGEPTLHPQIFDIIQQLLFYRDTFSKDTRIKLFSNGAGEKVNSVLLKLTQEIKISNSRKTSNILLHAAFNNAPKDTLLYKYADFSNGCCQIQLCGMGLNLYGFYPCIAGANIDRVLGFNIGRKKLPVLNDSMIDQLQTLCKYCGYFRYCLPGVKNILTTKEIMSPSWRKAYENYKIKKPFLTLY